MKRDKFELVIEDWMMPDKPPIYLQAENEYGLYWDREDKLHLGSQTETPGYLDDPILEQLMNNQLFYQQGKGPYKTNLILTAQEADEFIISTGFYKIFPNG